MRRDPAPIFTPRLMGRGLSLSSGASRLAAFIPSADSILLLAATRSGACHQTALCAEAHSQRASCIPSPLREEGDHDRYRRHFFIDKSLYSSYTAILAPLKDMTRRHTASWERGRCPRAGLQPAH